MTDDGYIKKEYCEHHKHAHTFTPEGMWCSNCDKKLSILETLDPNTPFTITNDGNGILTVDYNTSPAKE